MKKVYSKYQSTEILSHLSKRSVYSQDLFLLQLKFQVLGRRIIRFCAFARQGQKALAKRIQKALLNIPLQDFTRTVIVKWLFLIHINFCRHYLTTYMLTVYTIVLAGQQVNLS